jgi:DNA-binding cell septation regulator SpoVG
MKNQISEISIIPVKPTEKGLVAFCSFVLNNQFYIGDVAIYTCLSRGGYRLVYPTKQFSNKTHFNVCHPINKEVAMKIEGPIIKDYENLMKRCKNDNLPLRHPYSHI